MNNEDFHVIRANSIRSKVRLFEGLEYHSHYGCPNKWIQFWHWFLLGWKWTNLEDGQENKHEKDA